MDIVTIILFAIFFIPAAMAITGIILLLQKNRKHKKPGLLILLSSIILAGIILLIGNSICSNIHLGNMN